MGAASQCWQPMFACGCSNTTNLCASVCLCHSYLGVPHAVMLLTKLFIFFVATLFATVWQLTKRVKQVALPLLLTPLFGPFPPAFHPPLETTVVFPMLTAACVCSTGRGVSQCRECQLDYPSSRAQDPYPQQNPPRLQSVAASQPPKPKPVATRRTPRKRTLSLLDQDMVHPPREGRGHARGSREASRDDSSDARDQEAAHFLDGKLCLECNPHRNLWIACSYASHSCTHMSLSMISVYIVPNRISLRSSISEAQNAMGLGPGSPAC